MRGDHAQALAQSFAIWEDSWSKEVSERRVREEGISQRGIWGHKQIASIMLTEESSDEEE